MTPPAGSSSPSSSSSSSVAPACSGPTWPPSSPCPADAGAARGRAEHRGSEHEVAAREVAAELAAEALASTGGRWPPRRGSTAPRATAPSRPQGARRPGLRPDRAAHLPPLRHRRAPSEQRWSVYALSLLAFSLVSVAGASTCSSGSRASLPLNPNGVKGVPPATVVQHRGQLRHQHELAELRRRVDDEPPHADGGAGRAELRLGRRRAWRWPWRFIRGLIRRRSTTIGNFWVDLVRGVVRLLLPLAFVLALVFASQGVIQNLQRQHGGPHRSSTPCRSCPAVPSPARRPSRSSAPTAAASSTPTRPTRSRTRRVHQPAPDRRPAAHPLLA